MTGGARFDVTALGEMLLRLSVPAGRRLETSSSFDVGAAGSEGNALAALACLGRRCGLVSQLPANALGHLIARQLRAASVDLDAAVWSDEGRLGTFFVQLDEPPHPTRVVYDRANSAASKLGSDQVDWDYVCDTRIMHLSGITPALSAESRSLISEARERAHRSGVPVSFDINYREALWTAGEARETLLPLIAESELLFCSQRDAERVFGIAEAPDAVATALARLSGARAVVVSSGEDGAFLYRDGKGVVHASAPSVHLVDRLGAGDALAAGVLDGWLDDDLEKGLARGVLLAATALAHHGDFVTTTRRELGELERVAPGIEVRR